MTLKKIELVDLRSTLLDSYDLFICSSSFEDRCLSVASNVEPSKIGRALILANTDLIEYVGTYKNTLESLFGEKGRIVDVCTYDPLITADNLRKNIQEALHDGLDASILIDVTAMTHESLLILLRLLQLLCGKARITGAYANASEYSIGDDVNYKWLSRGIGEVRSILGYPGNIIPSRKTHLILIVGYEHERAAGLIESIEPNSIALGYGRSGSATTEKDRDANERYMYLVNQMLTSFSEISRFEIPCDDPYGTRDEIQRQITKAGDVNILIAPMNNKLSTIGAAWAAFDNENVQMCYARALSYNCSNYSSPGLHCYLLDLNWKDGQLKSSGPEHSPIC